MDTRAGSKKEPNHISCVSASFFAANGFRGGGERGIFFEKVLMAYSHSNCIFGREHKMRYFVFSD